MYVSHFSASFCSFLMNLSSWSASMSDGSVKDTPLWYVNLMYWKRSERDEHLCFLSFGFLPMFTSASVVESERRTSLLVFPSNNNVVKQHRALSLFVTLHSVTLLRLGKDYASISFRSLFATPIAVGFLMNNSECKSTTSLQSTQEGFHRELTSQPTVRTPT